MTKVKKQKFFKNLLKYTAPVFAIFFLQLSQGVDFKTAGMLALYGLYALASDYFSKIK